MKMTQDIVYCAGGIVWRETERGREVLLILSRDDRAWKFPKGHIDADDPSWDYAAQREVKEETGYDTVITDFAGFRKYPVKGRLGMVLKVVLYWHLAPVGEQDFVPSDEIEHCEWFTLREAVDRLTFLNDKQLLLSVADLEGKRDG
ncbi:MAG: NUDIX domain-containing protein [Blastocatellia bacterium]